MKQMTIATAVVDCFSHSFLSIILLINKDSLFNDVHPLWRHNLLRNVCFFSIWVLHFPRKLWHDLSQPQQHHVGKYLFLIFDRNGGASLVLEITYRDIYHGLLRPYFNRQLTVVPFQPCLVTKTLLGSPSQNFILSFRSSSQVQVAYGL